MYEKPIIERFGIDIPIDLRRSEYASKICGYLRSGDINLRVDYYKSIKGLLDTENLRILLYLPFNELVQAPDWFKELYRENWYKLLNYYDVRENFHKGDVFEEDARTCDLDRVVKCVHLIPWLLKSNYISYLDIIGILDTNSSDEILLTSFSDILGIIEDNSMLSKDELYEIHKRVDKYTYRKQIQPLYISEARIKWLNECDGKSNTVLDDGNNIDGPFSGNLQSGLIRRVEDSLGGEEVVLICGSRLKGYGTKDSDVDVFSLDRLRQNKLLMPGRINALHLYYNSVWVCRNSRVELTKLSRDIAYKYRDIENRSLGLERLESDLLQYRLLHKGFSRVTGKRKFVTDKYTNMDGDCPFYDDEYRKVATMLYAKYVYIPTWD